ncbi:hypothetical protein [Priestia megaterium]
MNLKSKTFWKYALIILCFPVLINLFLFQAKLPLVFGTEDNWLSFWGNYTGGLISAFVAYIIANSQIQKQLRIDLGKEKFYRTINQLPALIYLKIDLEQFIEELEKVKIEREKFINSLINKNNNYSSVWDEEEIEEEQLRTEDKKRYSGDYWTDIPKNIVDTETSKPYLIKFVNGENFTHLKTLENTDLHIELITIFNFYRDFSIALDCNISSKENRYRVLQRKTMGREPDGSQIQEIINLDSEIAKYSRLRSEGWKAIYEENMLDRFQQGLVLLNQEIEKVKYTKENADPSLLEGIDQ